MRDKKWNEDGYFEPIHTDEEVKTRRIKIKASTRKFLYEKKYGITIRFYDLMFIAQGGKCAICGGTNSRGHRLSVDHCHATGKYRGLLCSRCNLGLGYFKDNVESLGTAIKYLKSNVR